MRIPATLLAAEPALGDWCVLHAWRGSVAHGMWVNPEDPTSVDDRDTMAICVPPLDCYFGTREFSKRGTREIRDDPWDIVCYEIRKAIGLLTQGNPNILAMLWLPENGYIKRAPAGELLIERRELFIGQWVFAPFVGYARGQFHKMRSCNGLGYLGAKRKALVELHGYDCKNAAHMIRLLRMCCEFLKTGELIVDRGGLDATELLEIKRGEWTLEHVEREADRLFKRAEDAFDRCALPLKPDRDAINLLCTEMVEETLRERGEI